MSTFRPTRIPTRYSKYGVALLLLLPPVAAQDSVANEGYWGKLTSTTLMPPDGETTEIVYYFVASLTDGSQLSIPFSERPVLTCQDSDLQLTTTKMEMELPHGSVKEFTLDKKEVATGVEDLHIKGEMERTGNEFLFTNCRTGSMVSIFDRNGRRVAAQRVDKNGQCQISLQNQPDGVYIVKSESITCKILKK